MRTAVLLHGKPSREEYLDPDIPSASNFHWFPWLQNQLLIRGIAAHTPEVPDSWRPEYPAWCREFERYDIGSETIVVGHSCGAGFVVRWLSEHPDVRVGRVVLVAPWLDPDQERATDFFSFDIDPALARRVETLSVFNSDDDSDDIQRSVQLIRRSVGAVRYREFSGYGHFCRDDLGGDAFPELLDELVN